MQRYLIGSSLFKTITTGESYKVLFKRVWSFPYFVGTGEKISERYQFEFPAKTIFANTGAPRVMGSPLGISNWPQGECGRCGCQKWPPGRPPFLSRWKQENGINAAKKPFWEFNTCTITGFLDVTELSNFWVFELILTTFRIWCSSKGNWNYCCTEVCRTKTMSATPPWK